MRVVPIPCLTDNFAYYLPELGVVVDPSEAGPVVDALQGAPLRAVWCTHHHHDHVGGVPDLAARYRGLKVVGSADWRFAGQTDAARDGELLDGFSVMHVPGHTTDALAFALPGRVVFTGDTLFLYGCGRLFEGDAATMARSLTRLRSLPGETRVCCGHDYLSRNAAFARSLSPELAADIREDDPDSIAAQAARSPFLRFDDPRVAAALGTAPGVETFAAIRARRDRY